jgi:hypothetical protein
LIESLLPPETEDGIISSWAATGIQHRTSDLHSAEGIDGQQRNTASDTDSIPRSPKPVLPEDLPKALGYLDDQDLDRLLGAAIEEVKRRG